MPQQSNDIDIALYVALGEEFSAVLKYLGRGFERRELPDIAITCYFGEIHAPGRPLRLMVVPAGKMGNTRSANVVSAVLTAFSPKNLAVIGIAGSLESD